MLRLALPLAFIVSLSGCVFYLDADDTSGGKHHWSDDDRARDSDGRVETGVTTGETDDSDIEATDPTPTDTANTGSSGAEADPGSYPDATFTQAHGEAGKTFYTVMFFTSPVAESLESVTALPRLDAPAGAPLPTFSLTGYSPAAPTSRSIVVSIPLDTPLGAYDIALEGTHPSSGAAMSAVLLNAFTVTAN